MLGLREVINNSQFGMGAAEKKNSGVSNSTETHVILNVYDLTPINKYTHFFGFGIFHSGIQVHGREYGFGAHELAMSGVFEVDPKTCPRFVYRSSISLGCIKMPHKEFRAFIESVASEYHGDTYNFISKNCNHFTDDISWRLMGKHIPGWVNRLARVGTLCSCLLPEALYVTTVKPVPEYHKCSGGDVSESHVTTIRCETDTDDAEHLLSPTAGKKDVAFIKKKSRESKLASREERTVSVRQRRWTREKASSRSSSYAARGSEESLMNIMPGLMGFKTAASSYLPIYNEANCDAAKKDNHIYKKSLRGKSVHLIPLVVIFCYFILWLVSHPNSK